MPICPNKNVQEWRDLIKGLKERNPKLSDTQIDDLAHLAFFRKGDGSIPDIDTASDILFTGRKNQLKKEVKEAVTAFKEGKAVGKKEGELVGAIEQGKKMAAEIRVLQEKFDKKEISAEEFERQSKQIKDKAVKDAFLAGQMRQGREMAPQIRRLQEQVEKGEITIDQLKERVKELGYERMWKEAEARLAGEIEGKKAGRVEGVKVERKSQKEFASRVSSFVNSLVASGRISISQAKVIAKRAAKIGTSEVSYDKFVKYMENVIDNANYKTEMDEVRKMQKAANRGRTALSQAIKEFTRINPEDLPLDVLTKYKQALDQLTGKVKNPALMRDMFFDVMDYVRKSRSEYSDTGVRPEIKEIKTILEAEQIYRQIRENKLETVEDYEAAIRDTNALKRKINQLLNDGSILQKDYDALNEYIALTQKRFEADNKQQIDNIKKGLIDAILGKKIEPAYQLTEQEKLLLDNVRDMNREDMMKMSVNDLYLLNEAVDVANESYVDIERFQDALNQYESSEAEAVATQLNGLKSNDIKTQELVRRLMQKDDVYWEDALGLPVSKVGQLYIQIITPFRKGIGQYVKDINDTRKLMFLIEKNTKLTKEQHHKVGMIVHYLQEYTRQFDPKYKSLENVGKRDEFGSKLFNKKFTDKIASPELTKLLQEIYNNLPKGADGKIDIEDVYNDFVNGGGKYLTETERNYLTLYWDLMENSVAPKQEYANAMRGRPFERIQFYMPREEYGEVQMAGADAVSQSANKRNLTIKSSTGYERTAKDIMESEIPKTDFLYLMNKAAKSTARDYHITKMLKDINTRLDKAYDNINDDKRKYLDATVERMMEGLKNEISAKETDSSTDFTDKILSASAMTTLANPIRTFGMELPSGIIAYPLRSAVSYVRALSSLKRSNKLADELKLFTNSPLAIKENIQASFDADSQEIKVPSFLKKYVTWNSAFTERVLNNGIWVPKFEDAFFDATGNKFNAKEFETNPEYRKQFKKQINEAGTIADQAVQEIVGPTTTASARAIYQDLLTTGISKIKNKFTGEPIPSGLSPKSTWGKVVGYMGNWVYRDYSSTMKGLREASEGIREGNTKATLTGLAKPFGVLVNNAVYGYLGKFSFLLQKYIVSQAASLITGKEDEKDVAYAKKVLEESADIKGALNELAASGTQVALGKYGNDARILATAIGTLVYHTAKDKETKDAIQKFVRSVTFKNIPKIDKVNEGYYGKTNTQKEIGLVLLKSIPTASIALEALVNEAGGIEAAYDLIEKYTNGESVGTKEALAKALKFSFSTLQIGLIMSQGVSIPESRKIQEMLDKINQETKSAGRGRGGRSGGRGGRSGGR